MDGADVVRACEVATEQPQERAQALGSAGRERDGGGGFWDASDSSLLRTLSSAVLPTSGASANSLRSSAIFSSTVRA